MFSEAVDRVRERAGFHSNDLSSITASVNNSLRQLGGLAWFVKDTIEDSLTITDTSAASYIWPKPVRFRKLLTAKYPTIGRFVNQVQPGKGQLTEAYYWYEQSQNIIFNGVGGNTSISVFYMVRPRRFVYYADGARPAVWSEETESWTYLEAGNDSEKEAARDLVEHWLLRDWFDLVVETSLSTMWKDQQHEAARSTFALANQLKATLLADEELTAAG